MAYIGNSPVTGAFKKLDNITFNSVTTTFALLVAGASVTPGSAQNLIISISGVLQEPGVAYNISGNNIIFSEAPLTADTFFGVLLGSVGEVNTVTDGTITAPKLATDSVTLDKLAPASVSLSSDTITGTLPVVNGGTGGTSIKTINSNSIIGSGNIAVGDVTLVGTQTLTNKTITGLKETKTALGASAIDITLGNYFTTTIVGTTTFTVSNVPTTGTAASFILELTNGGSATVNWFSGVKWAGGTAPTLTTAGVDILGFYTHDGGTTWRGLVLAKDSK